MRTTLTLDDDLAQILKRKAAEKQRPFREIVNLAIRRGLQETFAESPVKKVETVPFSAGLRPGIDQDKMNQLADQLEVDAFASEYESVKQP